MRQHLDRHQLGKKFGRRVSRGEWERRIKTWITLPNGTIVLETGCPRMVRKHGDTIGVEQSRRARYNHHAML